MAKTISIGVALSSIIDPYQKAILQGIQDGAQLRGCELVCIQEREPEEEESQELDPQSLLSRIHSGSFDSLILFSAVMSLEIGTKGLENFVNKLKPMAVVSLGLELEDTPSILIDNKQGVKEMMDHVIEEHGIKDIAIQIGPQEVGECRDRYQAYQEALQNHSLREKEQWVFQGDFSPGDGVRAAQAIVNMPYDQRPKALLCQDDIAALEALHCFEEQGIPVPREMLVLGYDDIESASYHNPALTTVHQPLYEMGFQAVDMALEILSTGQNPQLIELKSTMINRETCGCDSAFRLGEINWQDWKQEKSFEDWQTKIKELLDSGMLDELHMGTMSELGINDLFMEVLKFLQGGEEQRMEEYIRRWYSLSHRRGQDAIYWIRRLHPVFQRLSMDWKMALVWGRISHYLLLAETALKGRDKLRLEQLHSEATELLDLRVIGSSRENLVEQLEENLSVLGIKVMLLCLYQKDPREVEILFSYCHGAESPLEERFYNSGEIFPKSFDRSLYPSYFMFPIHSQDKTIGYMLVDMGDLPLELYQDMQEKITKGLEGVLLMEEIQSYTNHLEEEVSRRTRQLQKANQKLQELSYKDHLSGLRNRRFLRDVIQPEAERLIKAYQFQQKSFDRREREPDHVFAIYLVDLDFFKDVNDTYGHESGDRVIQQLSEIFSQQCRLDDFVVRLGGEEFLLILKNFKEDKLMDKARKILSSVENYPFEVLGGEKRIHKTCTIGCISFPADPKYPDILDFDSALNMVDQALYYGKEHGRNQAVTLGLEQDLLQRQNVKELLNNSMARLIRNQQVHFISTTTKDEQK